MSADEEKDRTPRDIAQALPRDGDSSNSKNRALGALVMVAMQAARFVVKSFARTVPATAGSHDFARVLSQSSKGSGRGSDINTDPEIDSASHERWGTFFVACALLVAVAGAVGFLFIYWSGGNNELLGGCLALSLGGIGTTLVLYAHWLTRHTQATEPREILPSSPTEREDALETFDDGVTDMHRRGVLKWIIISTFTIIAGLVISLLRSLGRDPDPTLFSTVWKRGERLVTLDGTPVTVNALEPGKQFIIVFPENSVGDERAQTMLMRVKPEDLQLPWERSNWAPMGYVAYSRVCTHAGCVVGLYETTTFQLMCPCHQSTFDVRQAAKPTGGPAARPLPQLPLYVDSEGTLRAAGGFSAPPGPGFWWMPTTGIEGSASNA